MRIAIGADHAGYQLKNTVGEWLRERGHEVTDFGTDSAESVDYPEFAHMVGRAVVASDADLGIVVCGTGIGTDIAANKLRGVRSARCLSEFDARYAREHNDANVLSIGARVTGVGLALAIVETFLKEQFEGGRHQRRVAKLEPEADKPAADRAARP